jgi:hypothetical protein
MGLILHKAMMSAWATTVSLLEGGFMRKDVRSEGETPEMEARAHAPAFLKKAARMAGKKHGKRRGKKTKTGRY